MNPEIHHSMIVIGIGELLWDCFPTYRRLGGAPANFAYHAAQFGHKVSIVSALGKDEDGAMLENELKSHGLDYRIEKMDLPTGTVIVDTSINNDPQYDIKTEVAWSAIPFTNELASMARNCKAVCFGTLAQYGSVSRETIARFLDAVPEGCLKIYDINLRKNHGVPLFTTDTVRASIKRCNILKVNIDELHYLTETLSLEHQNDVQQQSQLLMKNYPNIMCLIVTMGTDGSWVFRDKEASFMETPRVIVNDVVGAGDSFTGAFVGSILNGKTMEEAHQIAVNVSAYVCTQPQGMPEMPELSKLSEILKQYSK